jgi:hypothetical protein
MSNWIDDEAEKYRLMQYKTEQKTYLITCSNYWADLTEQLRNDVDSINNNPIWKEVLQGNHIRIVKAIDGFKIEKTKLPAVYITVNNEGLTIELHIEIAKNVDNSTKYDENLEVKSKGERIYLVKFDEAFLIPEQASKYILSPILKALKGEV